MLFYLITHVTFLFCILCFLLWFCFIHSITVISFPFHCPLISFNPLLQFSHFFLFYLFFFFISFYSLLLTLPSYSFFSYLSLVFLFLTLFFSPLMFHFYSSPFSSNSLSLSTSMSFYLFLPLSLCLSKVFLHCPLLLAF